MNEAIAIRSRSMLGILIGIALLIVGISEGTKLDPPNQGDPGGCEPVIASEATPSRPSLCVRNTITDEQIVFHPGGDLDRMKAIILRDLQRYVPR